MLLADTSVWIDHLRKGDKRLADRLNATAIAIHPHIIGEVSLGSLKDRKTVIALLRNLPEAVIATDSEVLDMIAERRLHGRGIGYVDAHLLASTLLSAPMRLWTRDARLNAVAMDLGIGFSEDG